MSVSTAPVRPPCWFLRADPHESETCMVPMEPPIRPSRPPSRFLLSHVAHRQRIPIRDQLNRTTQLRRRTRRARPSAPTVPVSPDRRLRAREPSSRIGDEGGPAPGNLADHRIRGRARRLSSGDTGPTSNRRTDVMARRHASRTTAADMTPRGGTFRDDNSANDATLHVTHPQRTACVSAARSTS